MNNPRPVSRTLVLVILFVSALLFPLLAATFISSLGPGVGGVELGILYLMCISGAVIVWRRWR